MNKDSIYKIIGYNGKYNANVKKAIRKLLKENHPDNNGDARIFNLINDVKKELEDNSVNIIYEKNTIQTNNYEDIDYNYCHNMLKKAIEEKKIYTENLNKLNKKMEKYISDYKNNYHQNIEMESKLLSSLQAAYKVKNIKYKYVLFLIISIIIFIISLWKGNIFFFILFAVIVILGIFDIYKMFVLINNSSEKSKMILKKHIDISNNLKDNIQYQQIIKKEMYKTKKHIKSLENDIRFYENLLSNRR